MTVSQRSNVINKSPFEISVAFYIIYQRKQNMTFISIHLFFIFNRSCLCHVCIFSFHNVRMISMYANNCSYSFELFSFKGIVVLLHPIRIINGIGTRIPVFFYWKRQLTAYIYSKIQEDAHDIILFLVFWFYFLIQRRILFTTLLPEGIHRKLLLHWKRRNTFLALLRWML